LLAFRFDPRCFMRTYSNFESVSLCFSRIFEGTQAQGFKNAFERFGGVSNERIEPTRLAVAVEHNSERTLHTKLIERITVKCEAATHQTSDAFNENGRRSNLRTAHQRSESTKHFYCVAVGLSSPSKSQTCRVVQKFSIEPR